MEQSNFTKIPGTCIVRQTPKEKGGPYPWKLVDDRKIVEYSNCWETIILYGSVAEKVRLQTICDIHNANMMLGLSDAEYNKTFAEDT